MLLCPAESTIIAQKITEKLLDGPKIMRKS